MMGHICSKHKEELDRHGLICPRNTNFTEMDCIDVISQE